LTAVDPGFNPANLLLADTTLPGKKYTDATSRDVFYSRVVDQLGNTPGIRVGAGATTVPFGKADLIQTFQIVGRPWPSPSEAPPVNFYAVTPEYFQALGVPLRQGRLFTERDSEAGPAAAIVNERLARRYWPGENPIGKFITVDLTGAAPREVVGVVGDIKHYGLHEESTMEIYEPFRRHSFRFMTLVLKTDGNPEGIVGTARRIVRAVDPDIPLYNIRTMERQVSDSVAQRRLAMALLGGFAVLALILASAGVYAVMAFAVAQRTREIGVRMALGAVPSDILRLVLRRGMMLAAAGIASGVSVAFVLSRLMASQLYRVSTRDPSVYAAVVCALLLVALSACIVPARRAANVDPLVSLRYE
jgi:putative ABC transport system permease protein